MINLDYDTLQAELRSWVDECRPYSREGETAGYIPALGRVPGDILGAAVCDLKDRVVEAGDTGHKFTLQSISKIFSLILALEDCGPEIVFGRVGMEPTGDPFNSIAKLEFTRPSRPLNPMINAGAIMICDLVGGGTAGEKFRRIRDFVRRLSSNPHIDVDPEVYESEKSTGHRNRALAYFLKDTAGLKGDVEEILDIYFKQCSLQVSCRDLAYMGAVLANEGRLPSSGEPMINPFYCQTALAFMVTCGFYNGSGQLAVEVGVPAKSGVSGGILSSAPGRMGIGIIGPGLDLKGNSLAGRMLLARIAGDLNLSIFA